MHSARWAAGVASDCLSSDRLEKASLHRYQQRVQHSLGQDMAFSRLFVQLIRNRHLNPVWLRAPGIIASRAKTDPDYAYRVGCVVTGLVPADRRLGLGLAAKTAGQAMISIRSGAPKHSPGHSGPSGRPAPAPFRNNVGGTAEPGLPSREFGDWAAGVGRAVTELIFQLTHAKFTRSRNEGHWAGSAPAGRQNQSRHGSPSQGGPCQRSPAGNRQAARKDRA